MPIYDTTLIHYIKGGRLPKGIAAVTDEELKDRIHMAMLVQTCARLDLLDPVIRATDLRELIYTNEHEIKDRGDYRTIRLLGTLFLLGLYVYPIDWTRQICIEKDLRRFYEGKAQSTIIEFNYPVHK